MRPAITVQWRLGIVHRAARGSHSRCQSVEVIRKQRRVRLFKRMKTGFNAKVEADAALFEPGTASPSQAGRFGHLDKTQNIHIKSAGQIFRMRRNGKLNVVKGVNRHR